MTSGNSWEKRQVCDIDKIEIGTQLFEVKLCAACRTQQVVCKSSRSKRRGARCTLPLDATEPRLELELASADNLMAIA